jgi:hypothetical protein
MGQGSLFANKAEPVETLPIKKQPREKMNLMQQHQMNKAIRSYKPKSKLLKDQWHELKLAPPKPKKRPESGKESKAESSHVTS